MKNNKTNNDLEPFLDQLAKDESYLLEFSWTLFLFFIR